MYVRTSHYELRTHYYSGTFDFYVCARVFVFHIIIITLIVVITIIQYVHKPSKQTSKASARSLHIHIH